MGGPSVHAHDPGLFRRSGLVVIAVLLAGLVVAPVSSSAAPPVGEQPLPPITAAPWDSVAPGGQHVLSPNEYHDLSGLAAVSGITVADAIDSYAWHQRFSQLVAVLRERWPDDIAGARIERSGDSRAWIAFRGVAPAEAAKLIDSFPQPVAVRTARGYSEIDLARQLTEAHYAVLALTQLVTTASSGYDTATGEITVEIEPTAAGGRMARSDLVRTITAAVPAIVARSIRIVVVDRVYGGVDAVFGGGNLGNGCTTGFTVVGAVTRGVSSAAHCAQPTTYEGRSLRFIREHQGQFGDVEWHTRDGETHPNRFYWNSGGSLRFVFSTGAATEGQGLCRYGRASGYRCDFVYQLNHCNGNRCGLVAMEHRYAAGGDSGGPWFYDSTAYGIHQGYKNWFGSRDLYTPVVYLPAALGVSVATS